MPIGAEEFASDELTQYGVGPHQRKRMKIEFNEVFLFHMVLTGFRNGNMSLVP